MAFVTFRGTVPTLPLTPSDWHIQLTHPALADVLVLNAFAEGGEPYQRSIEGWHVADGRSITGAIRTKGATQRTEIWECSFLVKRPQWELFNLLLEMQQISQIPVTLLDRFDGMTDATNIWLSVDRQYLTPAILGRWWTLQFQALEEV